MLDLLTLMSRLECLRSVSAFTFPTPSSSAASAIRRITATRIVNDIRNIAGVGFSGDRETQTGSLRLPDVHQIDAIIATIRAAGHENSTFENVLVRVPPVGPDAARRLLGALQEEVASSDLDWTVGTVELSGLALELGLVDEAAALAAEALDGAPGSATLHDLNTICGCCELFGARTGNAVSHLLRSVDVLIETDAYVGGRNPVPNLALAERLLHLGRSGPVIEFLGKCKQCWPRWSDVLSGWMGALSLDLLSPSPREFETFNERNTLGRMAFLALIPYTDSWTNEDMREAKLRLRTAIRGGLPFSSN